MLKSFTLFAALILFLSTNIAVAEVNINTASAPELAEHLKNVGPAKAAAIVEYRNMHGAFKTVDELSSVQGIGDATVEMNKDAIILVDPAPKAVGQSGVADLK